MDNTPYNYEKRIRERRYRREKMRRRKRRRRILLVILLLLAVLLTVVLGKCGGEKEPPENQQVVEKPSKPQSDPQPQPQPRPTDWRLTLVNPWNPLPETWEPPEMKELSSGWEVDARCYDDLMEMLDGCQAAGHEALVCSAYRQRSLQETLFGNLVQEYMDQGMTEAEAKEEAAKEVAVPGTSEHQLGLAMDIVDMDYQILDDTQADTPAQKWLLENSWRYGFILRFPKEKEDITGIIYEPWHYRYVGREAAEEIYRSNLCLEEYLQGK